MSRDAKAISDMHRLFNRYHNADPATSFSYIEAKSNALREWYRKGQRAFRQIESGDKITYFNDLLSGLEGDERDGFLMGWNSDNYATQHNMQLSVEGAHRQEVDDVRYSW